MKVPQGFKCLFPEGEGRFSFFEMSIVKCATFLPSEAKEKRLCIENWLDELEVGTGLGTISLFRRGGMFLGSRGGGLFSGLV